MIIDTHCHLASAQCDQSRREAYVEHALREDIDLPVEEHLIVELYSK